MKNTRLIMYIFISGFLFFVDQLLKYLARTNFDYSYYIWKPWLGWEYFGNTGIAFSLPLPNWLIVFFTPFIILGVTIWGIKTFQQKKSAIYLLVFSLIILGAISNYIDRVMFGVTIDYLRVFTGIINLADIMIVGGVVLLILKSEEFRIKK